MSAPRNAAFSLIELLAVMAVIGMLATLSLVAMNGIREGRDLNQASSLVLDQLSLARQSALSKNARVRWLIISAPDSRNGDPAAFRRTQLELFSPAARAWQPLGRAITFPTAILADPKNSTNILTNSAAGATNAVTFLANGRPDLNPNNVFSLTLSGARNTNNFITIQLDPVSGRCRTFQP